jgi:hypothetical protein
MEDSAITYVDEEDCLGFKIWVAELELIVGGSRGARKPDADQVFLLLQKLVATLDRTDRSEVREYQRRCEDALIDVLLKGAPPPVSTSFIQLKADLINFLPAATPSPLPPLFLAGAPPGVRGPGQAVLQG